MTSRRLFLAAVFTLTAACAAPALATAADPVWQSPLTLSVPGPNIARPQVVAAPDGSVTVVWEQSNGATDQVAAKSRSAEGVWSDPVFVSDDAGGIATSSVRVVVAGDGSVTLSWLDNSYAHVRLSVKQPDAGTWSSPSSLGTEAGEYVYGGVLAAGVDDSTMALTTGGVAGDNKLRVYRRAAGSATFTVIGEIDQPDDQSQSVPSIAYNENGDAVAAWKAETPDPHEVRASRFTAATGEWSAPVTLGTVSTSAGGIGEILTAINDEGASIALWTTGYASDIVTAPVDAAGQTTAPHSLFLGGPMAVMPAIAADADGQFVAVWQEFDYTNMTATARTWSKTYTSASDSWSSPENVAEGIHDGRSGGPSLAANASGDMVVSLFTGETITALELSVARRASGSSAWDLPIATPATNVYRGSAGTPVASLDDLGNVGLAIPQLDGSALVTAFLAGDGSGPRVDGVNVPASAVAEQAVSVSASPFDLWSGVAATTWNFGDGGSATGASASHVYSAAGTYTVSVTSTDLAGFSSATETRQITVEPAPEPDTDEPAAPKVLPPVLEARLSGKKITLNTRVALRAGKKCTGKATATTKFGNTTYRTTLTLKKVNGKCVGTGTIKLKKTPSTRTKLRVTVSAKSIKTRTLTTKRG